MGWETEASGLTVTKWETPHQAMEEISEPVSEVVKPTISGRLLQSYGSKHTYIKHVFHLIFEMNT